MFWFIQKKFPGSYVVFDLLLEFSGGVHDGQRHRRARGRCPIIVTSPCLDKRIDFSLQMNGHHLEGGGAGTSAPDRAAGLRGGVAAPQLQEGGGGALRHADGDQPSDPPARAILRAIAFPPTSTAGNLDRGRRAPVSRHSRRI